MFSFYLIFYLVALVTALVNFKKFVDTPMRYFPLLIAYTLFNEVLGYFIINYKEFSFFIEEEYHWHNVIIYNIYNLIFLGYIFWVYFRLIKGQIFQKIIKLGALLVLIAYGISLFYQDPFHSDLYYADCLSCGMTIVFILLHFRQLQQTNGGLSRFNLMVWIGLGLLVFNLFFPFYLLNGYLNAEFFLEYHLRKILWGVISIMYSFFIVGFVISRRNAFR